MSTANIAPAVTTGAGSRLRAWIARRPLMVFFVLALALTWPYMIVDALGSWGLLPFRLPAFASPAGIVVNLLMGYGPAFAALIVTAATEGQGSVRALLRRLLVWQVGLQWYALAIFGLAIPTAITLGLYTLLGGEVVGPPLSLGLILQQLVLFLLLALFNGEELGWRGYALPRLQANRSALAASLILGMIVFLFHLPLFVTHGMIQTSIPILGYLVEVLAGTVITTWIYNNTRGSVLLAYLGHAATNTWGHSQVFHVSAAVPLYWLHVGLMVLVAVIVVVVYGPARLSRKPAAELPVPIDTSPLEVTDRTYAEAHRHA